VIKLILTTFEATSQLLWKVLKTPVSMETNEANNDESEKTWKGIAAGMKNIV
jgi:hypothetical protein